MTEQPVDPLVPLLAELRRVAVARGYDLGIVCVYEHATDDLTLLAPKGPDKTRALIGQLAELVRAEPSADLFVPHKPPPEDAPPPEDRLVRSARLVLVEYDGCVEANEEVDPDLAEAIESLREPVRLLDRDDREEEEGLT